MSEQGLPNYTRRELLAHLREDHGLDSMADESDEYLRLTHKSRHGLLPAPRKIAPRPFGDIP
jgi:hypothetical protein